MYLNMKSFDNCPENHSLDKLCEANYYEQMNSVMLCYERLNLMNLRLF